MINRGQSSDSTATVLGAGPAGTATALALARRGWQVVILHRQRRMAHLLGETLAPRARVLLHGLGIPEGGCIGQLPSPGLLSAWDSDQLHANDYVFQPSGCGFIIDRPEFDAGLLASARAAGVIIHHDARISACRRRESVWEIEAANGQGRLALKAQLMVDATGRTGWLAGRLGTKRIIHDRLVALVPCY